MLVDTTVVTPGIATEDGTVLTGTVRIITRFHGKHGVWVDQGPGSERHVVLGSPLEHVVHHDKIVRHLMAEPRLDERGGALPNDVRGLGSEGSAE